MKRTFKWAERKQVKMKKKSLQRTRGVQWGKHREERGADRSLRNPDPKTLLNLVLKKKNLKDKGINTPTVTEALWTKGMCYPKLKDTQKSRFESPLI